ncbi:MAG: tetratricopeptide repeat protein [Alphaproteobacteria bacterium]|nr:tetratricopeptide repeat protein [Alphaproteobacteria bacterium]
MTDLSETRRADILPGPALAVAPYFVLALAVLAVYGNIFDNSFLFDDDLLISINSWLHGWAHIGDILTGSTTGGAHIAGGFYRPVQMLLYLLIYHLGGGSTFGFHVLNLALHIANACLVYKLGTKLKFAPEGVFLAALVWALHPLHVEAVTYMSATADPLFAFCCLASIVILLPDFTPQKILKIFPLFLLGLLSKETMVMFPALVMCCIYLTRSIHFKTHSLITSSSFRKNRFFLPFLAKKCDFIRNPICFFLAANKPSGIPDKIAFLQERAKKRFFRNDEEKKCAVMPTFAGMMEDFRPYLRTGPLWVVSLLYVAWRMQAKGFDGPQTYQHYYGMQEFAPLKMYADHPLERIYTFLATLPAYLKLLVWPTGLHMERSFGIYTVWWLPPVVEGIGIFLLCAAVVLNSFRASRPGMEISWGLLWFAAAHAPDTGLLIPMNARFLEHWMYLPSVGLFLGIAEMLAKFLRGRSTIERSACSGAALAFAAMLSVMTYNQNKVWHDPVSFYNNIFAYGEGSARARNNLALYYSNRGDYDDALKQFQKAIETGDTYAETRYNLALTLLREPDQRANVSSAIENLKRSVEIDPSFFRSDQLLGEIYDNILHDKEKADYYYGQAAVLANRLK